MNKQDKKNLVINDLQEAKQKFISKNVETFITFDTLATLGKKMIWDIEDRFVTKPEMEVAEKNALIAMIELNII